MRFFGLGARVMPEDGRVGPSSSPVRDIYPALEKGVIDATEFSMPDIDQNLGFYQIAKNNYYPGWHQQVSCSELLMNRDAFNALPDTYKAMIEMATGRERHCNLRQYRGQEPGRDEQHEGQIRRHQPALG